MTSTPDFKRVLKYPFPPFAVALSTPGELLHVDYDPRGILCAWALVAPGEVETDTTVEVFGTGSHVPECSRFVNTFMQGEFVFHAFIVPRPNEA